MEVERAWCAGQRVPYRNVDETPYKAETKEEKDHPTRNAKLNEGYGNDIEEHEYEEQRQEENKQDKKG
jgi:hypothetical protein